MPNERSARGHMTYRLALYGVRASGKTCILAALAMPRPAHPLRYTCTWVEPPPARTGPAGARPPEDPYEAARVKVYKLRQALRQFGCTVQKVRDQTPSLREEGNAFPEVMGAVLKVLAERSLLATTPEDAEPCLPYFTEADLNTYQTLQDLLNVNDVRWAQALELPEDIKVTWNSGLPWSALIVLEDRKQPAKGYLQRGAEKSRKLRPGADLDGAYRKLDRLLDALLDFAPPGK
jgi:hypothetical protein